MKRFLSAHCHRGLTLAGFALLASPVSIPAAPVQAETQRPTRNWSNGDSYIFIKGGSDSIMMNGSTDDVRIAQGMRNGKEPLLYFRRGGKSYVIRDAAVLNRTEAIFRPQQELGARQGELGSRQGELGSRQGALGRQQAELGRRQAAAALRQLGGGRSSAAQEQTALSRQQSELGRQQSELGRQQAELGRQQSVLGAEQARLGREAQAKLNALVEDALRRGLAREAGR